MKKNSGFADHQEKSIFGFGLKTLKATETPVQEGTEVAKIITNDRHKYVTHYSPSFANQIMSSNNRYYDTGIRLRSR